MDLKKIRQLKTLFEAKKRQREFAYREVRDAQDRLTNAADEIRHAIHSSNLDGAAALAGADLQAYATHDALQRQREDSLRAQAENFTAPREQRRQQLRSSLKQTIALDQLDNACRLQKRQAEDHQENESIDQVALLKRS